MYKRKSLSKDLQICRAFFLLFVRHLGFSPLIKNIGCIYIFNCLDKKERLEEGVATHSSILAWRIPWTEVPGRLQSTGSHKVRQDWSNLIHTQEREKREAKRRREREEREFTYISYQFELQISDMEIFLPADMFLIHTLLVHVCWEASVVSDSLQPRGL